MSAPKTPTPHCRALMLEVSRLIDGELNARDRRRVEAHVAECTCCGRMAAGLRRTLAALQAEKHKALPKAVRTKAARQARTLLGR